MSLEVFEISKTVKDRLRLKVMAKPEIFSFEDDPALASLLACLGIQFEVGRPAWDRLSAAFGFSIPQEVGWKSEIIILEQKFGLRMWRSSKEEFTPLHPDFQHILHPLSVDENQKLNQLVIFPESVASYYRQNRGLELVIVKPWVTDSFLSIEDEPTYNYFLVNESEIENETTKLEAELASRGQIAFSGTHDLVDHLLGASREGHQLPAALYREAQATLFVSLDMAPKTRAKKIAGYLVGVLLDDLAQPVWYGSQNHCFFLKKSLELLKRLPPQARDNVFEFPAAFHDLMKATRTKSANLHEIERLFFTFETKIQDLELIKFLR